MSYCEKRYRQGNYVLWRTEETLTLRSQEDNKKGYRNTNLAYDLLRLTKT